MDMDGWQDGDASDESTGMIEGECGKLDICKNGQRHGLIDEQDSSLKDTSTHPLLGMIARDTTRCTQMLRVTKKNATLLAVRDAHLQAEQLSTRLASASSHELLACHAHDRHFGPTPLPTLQLLRHPC